MFSWMFKRHSPRAMLSIIQQTKEVLHKNLSEENSKNYQAALEALNGLQSNAQYLKSKCKEILDHNALRARSVLVMDSMLERSGVTHQDIDKLSIIHVTGTKGKGTTSALCESILRHHGYKTGFYSSPHLVNVTERIRINGNAIQQKCFARHFWNIYTQLQLTKTSHNNQMPIYFQMLTLMAFHVFLEEQVDVAIVEVGIGGEYDSTNFIRNSAVCGITSLGIDHTVLLGETIETIAWHKGGVIKEGSRAYTVPQEEAALKVLLDRSAEKRVNLHVVEPNENLKGLVKQPYNVNLSNATLAVALAEAWISHREKTRLSFMTSSSIRAGLMSCTWPGRYQHISFDRNDYYLDGAHTTDSIKHCIDWFMDMTRRSTRKRALIYNSTGDRDSASQLKLLEQCGFETICFVPNVVTVSVQIPDFVNLNNPQSDQLVKCINHQNLWKKLFNRSSFVLPSIEEALQKVNSGTECDVLITGSLHLVGGVLALIETELDRGFTQKLEHQCKTLH